MSLERSSLAYPQQQALELQRLFIQTVYAWMAGGLLVTALAAWITLAIPPLFELTLSLRWVLFVAMIVMVLVISGLAESLTPQLARVLFLSYAALTGVTLSVLFYAYTTESLATVFLITCGTFGATALYGHVTKRDLTSLGSFMFMGLLGLILASVVNLFLNSSALEFATSVVGVIVFVGLTAYDAQMLKNWAETAATTGRATNVAIVAALALYLDFINLFLKLLRLLGRRRS